MQTTQTTEPKTICQRHIRFCTRSITFGDFTRCDLYNSSIRLFTRSITFGDFTRCDIYNSSIRLRPGQSLLVISPDVFSIMLLLDCVPGLSLLVISPDVLSIILLSDCVPGLSILAISPDVLSIILLSCWKKVEFSPFIYHLSCKCTFSRSLYIIRIIFSNQKLLYVVY